MLLSREQNSVYCVGQAPALCVVKPVRHCRTSNWMYGDMTRMSELTDLQELKKHAEKIVNKKYGKHLWKYISYASGDKQTFYESRAVFNRYRFQPRILSARNVQDRTRTTLLGASVRIPICVSPTAAQHSVAPPKGDILTGLATAKEGSLMVLSSHADIPIEKFASDVCLSNGVFWAQTYLFRDRRNTLHMVRNAERLGFKAIVVTVDSPTDYTATIGRSDVTAGHLDPTEKDSAPNLKFLYGKKRENRIYNENEMWSGNSGAGEIETFCHPTWEDFYWLKSQTKLPIVFKGILSAHAAREAVKAGVAGILVSAHGGRQLEGSPASLEALVEVVDAVRGSNVEIYMDGGVRRGTDVLKALALGARAVFIGRPAIWGLAVNGEDGVRRVLQILEKELTTAMSMCGCTSLRDIDESIVKHESKFKSML